MVRIWQIKQKAMLAASQTYAAASDGRDLIADMQDGFAIGITIDDGAIGSILEMIMNKKGGKFPVKIAFDPTLDTNPSPISKCVGGPFDGRMFQIPKSDQDDGEMILVYEDIKHRYVWNGYVFKWKGEI